MIGMNPERVRKFYDDADDDERTSHKLFHVDVTFPSVREIEKHLQGLSYYDRKLWDLWETQ